MSYNIHCFYELHKIETIQWYESKYILHTDVWTGLKIPFLLQTSFPLFIFARYKHEIFVLTTEYISYSVQLLQ